MKITRREMVAAAAALVGVAVAVAPIVAGPWQSSLNLDFVNGGGLDERVTFTQKSIMARRYIPVV